MIVRALRAATLIDIILKLVVFSCTEIAPSSELENDGSVIVKIHSITVKNHSKTVTKKFQKYQPPNLFMPPKVSSAV
jgi:hypothetical protein